MHTDYKTDSPGVRHSAFISELVQTLRTWVADSLSHRRPPQAKQEGNSLELILFVL